MNVFWKAACAALLVALTGIEIGCGGTYRPIATPNPTSTGNPSGAETEVVLHVMPNNVAGNSVITNINVSGDTNAGNKQLGSVASSISFGSNRTTVFSANPLDDTVTQVLINQSTAGFSANTATISLPQGVGPTNITFQYFGTSYTQDFVVNTGTHSAICQGTGSLSAISQATNLVTATTCVGPSPVFAWIYKDQTKVFVLDSNGQVYVVSASKYKVTNTIAVGASPVKASQSADGTYVYVLNRASRTVSVIDGMLETVNVTVPTTNATCGALCDSDPIDIAQDVQFNDVSNNLQYNHIWILHANGTVSVYDATNPGTLTWITSLSTGANPTNIALMRDGTQAYVGLGGTDKIVAIDASKLSVNAVTNNATTTVAVGVHRSVTQALKDTTGTSHNVLVETTTPVVNYVAVSRQGSAAYLSKAYATTTTTTTYFYYDANVNPTTALPSPTPAACTDNGTNQITCPNLYNGTAVVSAVGNGNTPINSYITTVPAPSVVPYCDPGNPQTGIYDGQKNCPAMVPVSVLGRS